MNTTQALRDLLNSNLVVYARKTMAIEHLTEAVVACRHHQKVTKKIIDTLKKQHPEWSACMSYRNAEKGEPFKIQMWGNGLPYNDGIYISSYGEDITFEKLFAELRRFDFSEVMVIIKRDLDHLEEFEKFEVELRHLLTERRDAFLVNHPKHHYYTAGFYPLVFGGLPDRVVKP